MPNLHRLATVKTTGKKYFVNFVDFRANKVHCWGEVERSKGLKTWHGPAKVFLLEAVDLSEVHKDGWLVQILVDQMIASLREDGHNVEETRTRRGNRTYEIVPKKF